MVWIKICGITCLADAQAAMEAGADALGFVFEPRSRRYIGAQPGWQEWVAQVPQTVERVLVVANPEAAPWDDESAIRLFDTFQCYAPAVMDPYAWRKRLPAHLRLMLAFRIAAGTPISQVQTEMQRWERIGERFLLDTFDPQEPGGTGKPFDWEFGKAVRESSPLPLVLAGGLTPENVGAAIQTIRPFGVDVSTGVESAPGKKDRALMRRFTEAAMRET